MKKILLIITMAVVLMGCSSGKTTKNNNVAKTEYTGTYTLEYYYLETCPNCKNFSTNVIPLIEKEFGDHIKIVKYDLDDYSTKEYYDIALEQIVGFDQEVYGYGPFMVLDGYFAKLGLDVGDEEEFIQDLKRAITGEELGSELTDKRFLFKETKVIQ